MKKYGFAVLALALLSTSVSAGTWTCGADCDPATFKGIKWEPSTKCVKPTLPEISTKTSKAYNDSANAANNYINGGNTYFSCMNEELNADFTAVQTNMQETAKVFFEKAQAEFKTTAEDISAKLDEGLKKLNKK
jgi:hypothetical protein